MQITYPVIFYDNEPIGFTLTEYEALVLKEKYKNIKI